MCNAWTPPARTRTVYFRLSRLVHCQQERHGFRQGCCWQLTRISPISNKANMNATVYMSPPNTCHPPPSTPVLSEPGLLAVRSKWRR
jgi:hypothetical protein